NLSGIWNNEQIIFEASSSITSIDIIGASAQVIYSAGQGIDLNGGFEISQGSELHALIQGCDIPGIVNLQRSIELPSALQTKDGIELSIKAVKYARGQVTIFDKINHRRLAEVQIQVKPGLNKIHFDADPLDPGFYFCKIVLESEMHEVRLAID
ncbi:MAG: hypothetical protein IPL46_21520, partial [Saprospiraceae bacterium]|nr:hypothetical protein [Saprospiraceae bacterium]